MKVLIDHINHIRKNHSIPTQTIEQANCERHIPEIVLQELICVVSDEILELRNRLEKLENEP